MPSGSHGYGGSHSSSSRSGGYSGGSSRPRKPLRFHLGHSLFFFSVGAQSILSFIGTILVCCVVFAFTNGFSMKAEKEELKYLQNDRAGYVAMIERAEQDPELIVDGIVISVWQDGNGSGKWAFDYKFTASNGDIVDNGYSFKVYSSRSTAPHEGDTIKLAVDTKNSTKLSDSVPMDYKNFSLDDDGDYINAKRNIKSSRVLFIISLVGTGICIAIMVIMVVRAKQKTDGKYEDNNNSQNSTGNSQTTRNNTNSTTCEYCGASISSSDKSCPNCGAKLGL